MSSPGASAGAIPGHLCPGTRSRERRLWREGQFNAHVARAAKTADDGRRIEISGGKKLPIVYDSVGKDTFF
jgi:hypothetical protein